MNYLQLAQTTRQWSGTSSAAIGTVVGQTGQSLLIVDAVSLAWNEIQTKHLTWRWLRSEFSSANITAITPPAQAKYTAASSFSLTRFADWVHDINTGSNAFRPMTIYLTSTGLADESSLEEITWESWKVKYGRGVQTTAKPTEWAMSPAGEFCLGKFPDASYTLKGEYWKSPQTLAANTDEPEMPARFHMAIVWRAVLLLTEKDEADSLVYSRAENKYTEILAKLERDQLPQITIGGNPLA